MNLTVRITRSRKTRKLAAHVIQDSPLGELKGMNLLSRRSITRIESAKAAAIEALQPCQCDFDVQASPDVDPSYRIGEDKLAIRREVQS